MIEGYICWRGVSKDRDSGTKPFCDNLRAGSGLGLRAKCRK